MDKLVRSAMTLAVCSLAAGSCVGTINDSSPEEPRLGPANDGTAPGVAEESAGPLALQRLSMDEYNNTIRDLLGAAYVGVVAAEAASLPQTRGGGGFEIPRDDATAHVASFWDAADRLALKAAPTFAAPSFCDASAMPGISGERACARQLVVSFGRRALRRPLDADEVDDFVDLYDDARSSAIGADHLGGIALVLRALLQSPFFLYHWEVGGAAPVVQRGLIKLDGHQVASRLSYLLWGSMPDPTLFAAADAGQLESADGVAEQVRRMVRHRYFAPIAADFHRQWLGIQNLANLVRSGTRADPARYDDFIKDQPLYTKAMESELDAFAAYVLQGAGDGRLRTLLTAPFSFVNVHLAKIYGLSGVTGAALAKRDLKAGERAGLLTQPAFLARWAGTQTSSPILRGVWIWKNLLCRRLSPPPSAAEVEQAEKDNPPTASESTRQYFERLVKNGGNGVCYGCHQAVNPFGNAFEHYGAIGEYRTVDNGRSVDGSATVTIDGKERSFENAVGLVQELAGSEDVRRCVAAQWFRYALGRREGEAEKPSIDSVAAHLTTTDGDVREMLVAIARSNAFRYRAP